MTHSTKIEVTNINLRHVQEQTEDTVRRLSAVSRKAALAYAGLWGLALDEVWSWVSQGEKALEQATTRGEEMEAGAAAQVQAVRRRIQSRADQLAQGLRRQTAALQTAQVHSVEAGVQEALTRLNIPSREHIAQLNAKIDALNAKIDAQLAAQTAVPLPFVGYNDLNVREVIERLDLLDSAGLAQVQAYESAHAQRVTLLREIDRRLEAGAA